MKLKRLLKIIRFWPPFLGAGIRVSHFNAELTEIVVQMRMHFWNKNYVGTHFGGSLYSMTDPFYMLLLMHWLGKGYIVWDKAASIRYRIPARGTVYAHFTLTPAQVGQIRAEVTAHSKTLFEFVIPVTNDEGKMVAEVVKTLHIALK